jgi:PAS domain S-box-containing protein
LNLGVDDYFIKPIDSSELIMSIENKLLKFKKLKEMGKSEYKKLLETSPNGIFIFDGHILLEANPAFLKIFRIRQGDITSFTLAEFLEIQSLQKVKEHISQCLHGLEDTFHEEVTFTLRSGESFDGTLYISIFEKHIGYAYMTGLILLKNTGRTSNGSAISEVQDFFKSENINLPYSGVMRKNNGHTKSNLKDLFSEREKEVICLSMEGHPTKIIADKLSISDRTVEKHRANLMEKTNSNNMIEVIVYAIKNNLISIQ